MKIKITLCIIVLVQLFLTAKYKADSCAWRSAAYRWGEAFTNMETASIHSQQAATEAQQIAKEAIAANSEITIEEFAQRFPQVTKANLLLVGGAMLAGKDVKLAEYLYPFALKMRDQLQQQPMGEKQ